MKYQKGRELWNANQKRASSLWACDWFQCGRCIGTQKPTAQWNTGSPKECLHRYLHILQANRTCAAGTQSGGKQKASVWFSPFPFPTFICKDFSSLIHRPGFWLQVVKETALMYNYKYFRMTWQPPPSSPYPFSHHEAFHPFRHPAFCSYSQY